MDRSGAHDDRYLFGGDLGERLLGTLLGVGPERDLGVGDDGPLRRRVALAAGQALVFGVAVQFPLGALFLICPDDFPGGQLFPEWHALLWRE